MACQKDDGQVEAALAQLRQQINAGGGRQGPIQYDEIGIGRGIERCQERFAIGEPLDRKASLLQLPTERFPEIVVVLNEEDAYRPLPPINRHRLLSGQTLVLLFPPE
jgi:hypothetical protein